ncbi:MAG: hypothetical protein ACFCVA_19505 [Gammaproteobacteria bacterium]
MPITKRMAQVIARISALPEKEQEYYATLFLEELEDETKWHAPSLPLRIS